MGRPLAFLRLPPSLLPWPKPRRPDTSPMRAIAGGNGMARVGCEAVGGQVKSHSTGHGTVGVDTPHATVEGRIVVTYGRSGITKRSAMSADGSLIKIGALFFAGVVFTAVPTSKGTYAQNGRVGNFGHSHGSFHGRSGFVQNRGVRNFGRFRGSLAGGPGFVADLITPGAASDQLLWSCRAWERRQKAPIMMHRRRATICSNAFFIDTCRLPTAGPWNPSMSVRRLWQLPGAWGSGRCKLDRGFVCR